MEQTTGATQSTQSKPSLTNEQIAERVKLYMIEMESANSKIKELQEYCKHEDQTVELVGGHLRKVCKHCHALIGFPTRQEKIESGWITA